MVIEYVFLVIYKNVHERNYLRLQENYIFSKSLPFDYTLYISEVQFCLTLNCLSIIFGVRTTHFVFEANSMETVISYLFHELIYKKSCFF